MLAYLKEWWFGSQQEKREHALESESRQEKSEDVTESEDTSEYFVFQNVVGKGGKIDLIFIHGLTGDPKSTWSSPGSGEHEGDYWPTWIHTDIPGVNIYTLGYPASLFAKWAKKEMNIYERAKATLHSLKIDGLGRRPIALVTHSLGGVLAKQILRTGLESPDPAFNAIAENCRLVVFLATPHTGSSLASILTYMVPRLIAGHVDLLQSGGDQLDELNQAYRTIALERKIQHGVYYEKHKSKNLAIVVERADADPGIAGIEIIPVDADHLNICKPKNRKHDVYRGVCYHISSLMEELDKQAAAAQQAPAAQPPPAPSPAAEPREEQESEKITHLKEWLKTGDGASEDVTSKASQARRNALKGKWEGMQRQPSGPGGQPIQYYISVDIGWEGNSIVGVFRYRFEKDGSVLADETMPLRGTFTYDRFLKLNYEDTVSGKLQFGSLLLELSDDGQILQGVDLGFGYNTKKIMAAENTLHKRSGQS